MMALPMCGVVLGLVGLSYVPKVILSPLPNSFGGYFDFVGFNILVVLLLASYIQCATIDPGTVPAQWHSAIEANESFHQSFKRCRRCNMFKPPRSHFDSVTERLVLNFDHFCPWVINSVGFYNRKFFVLFLFYTLSSCLWFLASIGIRALSGVQVIGDGVEGLMTLMAILMDTVLGLALTCFLGFHVKLVIKNETTIEEGSVPQYDLGWRQNVEMVFGRNPYLWLIPVYGSGPSGDGVHWPVNDDSSGGGGAMRLLTKSDSIEGH
jgi:palmitoyltransferase